MRIAIVLVAGVAGAAFGWADAVRSLLRPASVLVGAALPVSIVLHAALGALAGLALALPARRGGGYPRATVLVGAPVAFLVLLANVDWLPSFTSGLSLTVDVAGLLLLLLGVAVLAPRLGPPRPRRAALALGMLLAASPALALLRPARAGEGEVPLVDGSTATSVVVIVVDTLRADALGTYGYGRPTDPRLRALAGRGVVIENARATSSWTKPSTGTILTGLQPAVHGAVLHDESLSPSAETLAEVLRAVGHRTAAFSANPWVTPTFGFGQGFDRFESRRASVLGAGTLLGKAASSARLRFRDPVSGALGRLLRTLDGLLVGATFEDEPSGDLLADRALAWLDGADGPFFLYLHLMEPHTPYAPPEPFRTRFDPGGDGPAPERYPPYMGMLPWDPGESLSPERLARLRGAYDGEVAAADAAIGRLLDGLERRGRLADALVVVLSDHGEEFADHGAWGHGHSLYREVVRVPWILRLPRDAHAGRRVTGAASTADLVPTILDLLGLARIDPVREPDGISLAPAVRGEAGIPPGRVVLSEVRTAAERLRLAATAARVLIAHDGRGSAGSAVFDLRTDPGQTRGAGAAGDALERPLREGFRALEKRALGSGRASLSEEEREALRGLGYVK